MAEFAVRRSTQKQRGDGEAAAAAPTRTAERTNRRKAWGKLSYSRLGLTALGLLWGAGVLSVGSAGVVQTANAQTTGNVGGVIDAPGLLNVFGFPIFGDGTGKAVTFTNTAYGYIKNNYIGVTVGLQGSYPTPSFEVLNGSVTHNIAGMISFGNVGGSLLTPNDDNHALNGLETYEEWYAGTGFDGLGNPVGWGVWPLASWWVEGSGLIITDNSSYVRALVDSGIVTTTGTGAGGAGGVGGGGGGTTTTVSAGTLIPIVGGDPATVLIIPTYIPSRGVLATRYQLVAGTGTTYVNTASGTGLDGLPTATTPDFIMDEYFELYRGTARIHWKLYNGDIATHNVILRLTIPVRPLPRLNSLSYYFVDPVLGITNSVDVITSANLPDTLTFYGQRVEDPSNVSTVPFAAKQILRGFGATTPTQVYFSDPIDVRPSGPGFQPGDIENRQLTFQDGIAESLYFGTYTVAPGSTQDIYTFYGNGAATENLASDVVVGAEATESLTYNTAAATSSTIAGNAQLINSAAQIAAAQQAFITPSPIPVKGSVYNRSFGNAQLSQQLTNTSLSLVLPSGLSLADVPGTTTLDTATKSLGTVGSDTDKQASWYLQATGSTYGALSFQMSASSDQIAARAVTRVINVPATPLHPVTNTSFQLLGFPFEFDKASTNNSDPATIINTLAPTNLQDNPAIFYYWVPNLQSTGADSGHYAVATSINPGQGYFFRPASTRTIFAYGAYPYPSQAAAVGASSTTFGVAPVYPANLQRTLQPGWNMISNPYLYPIPLSTMGFAATGNGSLAATTYNFQNAVSAGLVQGSVFYYDTTTGGYDFFDFQSDPTPPALVPWVGYWIFVNTPTLVGFPLPAQHNSYVAPDPTTGVEDATRGVIGGRRFRVNAPNLQNWTLQLVAKAQGGDITDQAALIGVKNGVTTKNQTIAKPPTPANNYVYIGLTRDSDARKYAAIYQPQGSSTNTWNFEVTSDQTGPVTLSWPNIATQPRQLQFTLKNLTTGQTSSLKSVSSLKINSKSGQTTKFQLVVSPGDSLLQAIRGLHVVRTGTRAAGTEGVDIVFNLSRAATSVAATVTTLNGKLISTIVPSTRSASVGQTRLRWNGKNDNGASIPPGPYKVEVVVQSESGDTVKESTLYTSLR